MAADGATASGLVVAALFFLAACGGAGMGKTTVVTETNIVTVTGAAPTPAPHDYARFRMPSKNVGCIYEPSSDYLRCDILSGLVPEPSKPCELDWTGFILSEFGPARPECAGDTVYDEGAPVLAYGESWSRAGMLCESLEAGLRCQNGAGHGFTLARGSSASF